MKKNTVKVLLLLTLSLAGTVSFAQSAKQKQWLKQRSDIKRLQEHVVEYAARFYAEKAEALRLAELNNWPIRIEKDGGLSVLVKVSKDGTPIYLTTHNQGSALTSRSNYLQPGGALGLNLTGAGMNVGIWDGDYPLTTHEDFQSRFIPLDGPPNPTALHPTHTLGTLIGAGLEAPTARGIAYEGTALVSDFENDGSEMAAAAWDMTVSNHSYGFSYSASLAGAYIDESKEVDEIMFDAPYYQPCFSAGNDGNGSYDRMTDRSMSKNGIAVAAMEQPVVNSDGTISASNMALAGFSSWGPSNDNRVKPDIANKGVHVYSCSDASTTAHDYLDGTSMSCPGTAGALILVQQHYSNLNEGEFMLSSTLRALLAGCADDAGDADGPDSKFGWGVINAKKMAETITKRNTEALIYENILLPGTTFEISVNALGDQPLVATLAWTDPAHNTVAGSGSVLVNNLDLRVKKGGTTTLPWKLNTSQSGNAVRGDNNVDNIEKIDIAEASGTYTITVSHKGTTLVNPATDGTPQQQYSLVITGVDGTLDTKVIVPKVFSVWPNPANGVVNISLTSGADAKAFTQIYDIQGRLVKEATLTGIENSINIQGLTSGVYFVNVTNGLQKEVKKVIIK